MHLGRIKGEKEKIKVKEMNKVLKQKAYQVLIDSLDVAEFEERLYKIVDDNELKSNSLLFDFVNIDYKLDSYKDRLLNIIKSYCSEEELLSLEVYSFCLILSTSKGEKIIFNSINSLSGLNVESDYQYDMLYEFYRLEETILGDEFYYHSLTKEEIIIKAKLFSEKVISKFNFYKEKEDWSGFLNCIIEKEEIESEVKRSSYIPIKQNESLFSSTINLLKGMLRLK
jgi:hypothetical protein